MTLHEALGLYNYWIVIVLMMTGFYLVIARGNLIKTIIGLNIFQTSVVLLYVTMGKVTGENAKGAPILPADSGHDSHAHDHGHAHDAVTETSATQLVEFVDKTAPGSHGTHAVDPIADSHDHAAEVVAHATDAIYTNPLPSVLMLTAIVVGVATTALALALTVRVREEYGTIEEDEILELDRNS